MSYENRQPPEGINYVERGWARDFILLVVGFFATLALLCWLLLQFLAWSSRWIPFSWEQKLTQAWPVVTAPDQRRQYLQVLTDSLAQAGGLAPAMALTVHFVDDANVNALATLGGNIIIFKGLLDTVENEQGLAFVIAHEIAHVHYRHPIRAFTRSLSLGLITSLVFGQTDLARVAGTSGNLALLSYSREQEIQADSWALAAVNSRYGHVAGADELFRKLSLQDGQNHRAIPEWLATHPDLDARIAQLEKLAVKMSYPLVGELLPVTHAHSTVNTE